MPDPYADVTGDQNPAQTEKDQADAIAISEKREQELRHQLAEVEQARDERMTPDTDKGYTPITRYHIHRGGQGLFTVMRTVTPDCDDWEVTGSEGKPGPSVYFDNVCVCSSPFTALYVARALEANHPDGNIV